jgi:acetyl esterase/lipase
MSVQYGKLVAESKFGTTVQHHFVTQEGGSDKLLIILPGRGYTAEHPVLYYLRSVALELGYDVLSVQYGFQAGQVDLTAENMPYVQDDVEQARKAVLSRGYSKICVAGKSMGTPLAVTLAHGINEAQVSLLLLTPIGGAAQPLDNIPVLAVIGTADAAYAADMIKDEGGLSWRVFEGLDHSLEVRGDWRASLAVLPEIIEVCAGFLEAN